MSVEDLCTGQGVVLGRAATILQSIENQPFDWMMSCELYESCVGQRAFGIFFILFKSSEALVPPWVFRVFLLILSNTSHTIAPQ